MKDVLVFGSGKTYNKLKTDIYDNYNVVGILDNDIRKQHKLCNGKRILPPTEVGEIVFDEIVITSSIYCLEMIKQLMEIGISFTKINTSYLFDDLYIDKSNRVIAVKKGVLAELTDGSDCAVMAELSNEYKEIEGLDKGIFIDVGMNVGIVSMYYASKNYIEKVYAFEPFTLTYEKALKNFSQNRAEVVEKIQHNNYGLGYSEEVRFITEYNQNYSGGNSTLTDKSINIGNQQGISVIIKNAASEIEWTISENPDRNIVCKIDTEGSEYEIIDILNENRIVDRISAFIMEYHPVKDRSPDSIKQVLMRNGFTLKEFPMGDSWGMLEAINSNSNKRV